MAAVSTQRVNVWHIVRCLVTDMIHWVLTPAREVTWMGVPYSHFTDEKTDARDTVSKCDPRPAAMPAEAPLPCQGRDPCLGVGLRRATLDVSGNGCWFLVGMND